MLFRACDTKWNDECLFEGKMMTNTRGTISTLMTPQKSSPVVDVESPLSGSLSQSLFTVRLLLLIALLAVPLGLLFCIRITRSALADWKPATVVTTNSSGSQGKGR